MRCICWTLLVFALCFAGGCSKPASEPTNAVAPSANNVNAPPPAAVPANSGVSAAPVRSPSNKFTEADVAKLKWLQGTWKGINDGKPFYERYRFEGSTLVVEGFDDEKLTNVSDTSRFELKNGEFGNTEGDQRSAATEITDDHVQFVPVGGSGNSFRFERQSGGTWQAVLEWTGPDNNPRRKTYIMEPFKK